MGDSRDLNVLVMGEIGSGKSSVINLLVGKTVAKVSPDAEACTLKTVRHEAMIQVQEARATVHIWEVVGFNQPEDMTGKGSGMTLDVDLDPILQAKASVDVIFFCMQGSRLKNAPTRVVKHINDVSGGRITIVLVITNLEREKNMEDWWERNGRGVQNMGLGETEHACITGLQDEKHKVKSTQSRTSLVAILERRWLSPQDSVPLESILGEYVAQNGGSESSEKVTRRKDSSWWRFRWPF
ncbi:hypothetical protein PISMIDRAFT_684173 [Pisolithus microcarpus 441]|uniref:G domain-containing protein n=1 Tax=Pisolithus microcarpus 441 TaxID=765257 RepID=A0A0C9Y1E6_9AGAM|nr:hypothetical protein BKA83DRAFT_684173 [Pisolithus microcarpus]KIK18490.1 hypothetical protein PISMIDRAFT_684173 [Pisolithus microcarpus 441]